MKKIIIFFLIAILFSCANQMPPSGGPIDTIPPEVIEFYPANGTVNFNEKIISITFSEYVEHQSAQEAIFISPNIDGQIEYNWSGKTLEIEFENELKKNTTYTVSVGTEVKDINNRNRMVNALLFSFSTGNKIDTYTLDGKIFGQSPENCIVFAYKNPPDTLNLLKQKPDFISQAGKDGNYFFSGLGKGEYRIFAFEDKFKDLLYNIEQDRYAVSYEEKYTLNEKDTAIHNVNFYMSVEDTTAPIITEVVMTDQNHFLVKFNEQLSHVGNSLFYIFDSTNQKRTDIRAIYKGKRKENELLMVIQDTLKKGENYFWAKNLRDKSGNVTNEDKLKFEINSKKDTLKPQILKAVTTYKEDVLNPFDPIITVLFNDAVKFNKAITNCSIRDKKNRFINFNTEKIDDASFKLILNGRLNYNDEIKLTVLAKGVEDLNKNEMDSTFTKIFKVENPINFSGLSGKIDTSYSKSSGEIFLILKNLKTGLIYRKKIINLNFSFENILPGKYFLWGFRDKNKNGIFDYGRIKPFKTSEYFCFQPDTLFLKARWPLGDLIFKF